MSKRRLENATRDLPATKKQKFEGINATDALKLNVSHIELLIGGYLRENKILKCFYSIICGYFPILCLLKNATYDPFTNECKITRKGRCIFDIGLDKGKYEITTILKSNHLVG